MVRMLDTRQSFPPEAKRFLILPNFPLHPNRASINVYGTGRGRIKL
jgi:hypothetical protein